MRIRSARWTTREEAKRERRYNHKQLKRQELKMNQNEQEIYSKSGFEYYKGMKKQSILNYLVFFKEEPEGGFTVIVPSLQGCVSYGETLEEAKKMAEEAITLYIEDLVESGEEVPSDDGAFSLSMSVAKPSKKKVQYA